MSSLLESLLFNISAIGSHTTALILQGLHALRSKSRDEDSYHGD